MTRSMYIAVAVCGLVLVLAAAVAAVAAIAPPGYDRSAGWAEAAAAVVGVGLAWGGLVGARSASEFGVRASNRARDRRPPPVAAEVAFDCPTCGRSYRAAGQMAGLPFACRACDARFTVPRGG